jgi:hypothetical protein
MGRVERVKKSFEGPLPSFRPRIQAFRGRPGSHLFVVIPAEAGIQGLPEPESSFFSTLQRPWTPASAPGYRHSGAGLVTTKRQFFHTFCPEPGPVRQVLLRKGVSLRVCIDAVFLTKSLK